MVRWWRGVGVGTLCMSCGLTLAAIEPVDARSFSDEADAEPTQSERPSSMSTAMGQASQMMRSWPALGVQGLSPLWSAQGTPDGTGDGAWPEQDLTEELPDWMPPEWSGDASSSHLWLLDGIDGSVQGVDSIWLHSKSAFAYDIDSGEVLIAKSPDDRLPVASLTKLISGLTVSAESSQLDAPLCLDEAIQPSWPGATTRLETDLCTRGWDLLGAAVVRSDNGAALALAEVAQLPYAPFVLRMNEVAQELGMQSSEFTDPTGVEDTNLSTARDMTRAVVASSVDPSVATVASAPHWDVENANGEHVRRLHSTNHLHRRSDVQILAAKTGYTDTARHCFSAVVQLDSGRRIALTTLGAKWSKERWSDVNRILSWARQRSN